ncbi:hypothetical protein CY34DRAFT_17398 [Suillus luteus UH-Slu-Lm8-n1]|uniref:Uncharacterized protein n=1 Tax=Suillus luteus UH-Slu-Lm8-n1 TaxID=930992 RepID=A0A0D0AKW3_9AGAM|nr:hypothetical protein CY34DRAFT_17398 [Suillus luteus UH-Slu-Lm8-n1]
MRTAFSELRLCSNGWKATSLAVEYYSQWKDQPREAVTIAKTEMASSKPLAGIKTESISHAFSRTHSISSKSSKRPLSLTLATSAPPHMKKTKTHTISAMATADASDSVTSDVCSITAPSSVVMVHEPAATSINCLSNSTPLSKNNANPSSSVPATLATTTVDADDSELTLTALLEKASFDDSPNAGEILPDQYSKVSFMEKLRASFDEQKESVAHSTPAISATMGTSKLSSNNTSDLGGILRKKRAAADSNSIMRTNGHSTTACNLCTIDWCKVNHKGTVGQFALYWDSLDAVAKKVYDDRSKLVKAAKTTAIASLPTATALVTIVVQPSM